MGVRAGQGFGQKKPKRQPCTNCGKRGMTTWKATPHGVLNRGCQYCHHQENKPLEQVK